MATNKELVFEPTFDEIQRAIADNLDEIYASFCSLPCLESKIYMDYQGRVKKLHVSKNRTSCTDLNSNCNYYSAECRP